MSGVRLLNMGDERVQIRADVPPDVKDGFDAAHKKFGVSQKAALRELMRWFAEQDGMMQALVLGQIPPDDRPTILTMLLKRMADEADTKEPRAGPKKRQA